MKILVTCPPMLGMLEKFLGIFDRHSLEVTAPKMLQVLSENELIDLLPKHHGWIIGDDPATKKVLEAGKAGYLRAAIKWGIGVDNVDIPACNALGIKFENTPNMFGAEVADVAVGYLIGLSRGTFEIDRGVRDGGWPKPIGISLAGKTVAIVGYGDIGRNTARRLLAFDMNLIVYDPAAINQSESEFIQTETWPHRIAEADFIVFTCALTKTSYHMLNEDTLKIVKRGVRIVNVSRGPVINGFALEKSLMDGQVYSAALDVFEMEPLPSDSYFRQHPRCILGSHNASNTSDAVIKTSMLSIQKLFAHLGIEMKGAV